MKLSKNMRRLWIIGGVAIVCIVSYLLASLILGGKPQPAYDITGTDADGALHSLSDHFGKEPVVLLFFDTKTDKAIELLEQLQTIEKDYSATVLAIACNGEYEEQKNDLEKLAFDLPLILFDTDGKMAKTYNVNATPVTYFIDKSGMVQNAFLSSITDKTLKKAFAALD